jgi:hypothetical protein
VRRSRWIACGAGIAAFIGVVGGWRVSSGRAVDRASPPASTSTAAASTRSACRVPGYLLDDAYDATCGFCYATSTAALPPPIAWRPCGEGVPSGVQCRQMIEDWDSGPRAPEHISPVAPAWVHGSTVTFALSRLHGDRIERIVADADGPVRQAIVETAPERCTLGTSDIRDGRVVYRVYDSETGPLSSYGGGSYGADVGELRPRVFTHYHDRADSPDDRSYTVSALGLFELGTRGFVLRQYDWATGALLRTLDSAAAHDGYAIAHVWPRSDGVFWDSYRGSSLFGLRSWTPARKTTDLVGAGSDWTRGVADLGADERWIVWSQGESRPSPRAPFDTVHLMKAPASAGADRLAGTPLAGVSGVGFSSHPVVVGCGYAATLASVAPHALPTDPQTLLLFRLSDGARWSLPNTLPMVWSTPLALSCTELFSLVAVPAEAEGKGTSFTIARVRLDSLGPAVRGDAIGEARSL